MLDSPTPRCKSEIQRCPDSDADIRLEPVAVWADRAAEVTDVGHDATPPRAQDATQIFGRLCGALADLMAVEALAQHCSEVDLDDLELLGSDLYQRLLAVWQDAAGLSRDEIGRRIAAQERAAA